MANDQHDDYFDVDDERFRRRTRKVKEAEEIWLQPLPTGLTYRARRLAAMQLIIAAAGRQDDTAMAWVLNVEGIYSTDELDHP